VREICVDALSHSCQVPKVRQAMQDAAINDNSRSFLPPLPLFPSRALLLATTCCRALAKALPVRSYVREAALWALHRAGYSDSIEFLRKLVWRMRDFGEEQQEAVVKVVADALCVDEGRETVTRKGKTDEEILRQAMEEAAREEEQARLKAKLKEEMGMRLSSFADDEKDEDDKPQENPWAQYMVKIDADDDGDQEDEAPGWRRDAKSVPPEPVQAQLGQNARRRSSCFIQGTRGQSGVRSVALACQCSEGQ
jgi:hypothetical protein